MVSFLGRVGNLDVSGFFMGLPPTRRFGAEYLTYVLWAITPEGRPVNLAEIRVEGADARLVAPSGKPTFTSDLKAFGLIVTAEPYCAVTSPSDVVVMENEAKAEASGSVDDREVKYDPLPKGFYTMNASPEEVRPIAADPGVTFEVLEARNAIRLARWAGAERYAPESLGVAIALLRQAEIEQARKKPDLHRVMQAAREAVEIAEDARVFALKRRNR